MYKILKNMLLRTLDNRHDSALLNRRRALETVGVDATQKLALEVHGIEAVGGLIVVGFDLTCVRMRISHYSARTVYQPIANFEVAKHNLAVIVRWRL